MKTPYEMTYSELKEAMKLDILNLINKHWPELKNHDIIIDFENEQCTIIDLPEELSPILGSINRLLQTNKLLKYKKLQRAN